jgi:hypothetical protein
MDTQISDFLTLEEEDTLVALLSKLGSRWSPRLYNAMAKKCALTAIETVFLKEEPKGAVKVLLLERPADDAYYAGMLHSPGSILRATDQSYINAFTRVSKELGGVKITKAKSLGSIFHSTPRGPENAVIFLCEPGDKPKIGKYYALKDATWHKKLIEHHHAVLDHAVLAFQENSGHKF